MKLRIYAFFLFLIFSEISAQNKGYIFAIGGGERPSFLMQRIVELAGGSSSKIVIIPNASSEPVVTALDIAKDFQELGCSDINFIFIDSNSVDSDSSINKLHKSKIIFFAGGDQNRLTGLLLRTAMLARIKEIYNNGGVIGGTSAGAAVLSGLMITGEELLNPDTLNSFSMIKTGNIKTTEGFAFVPNVIIDQHFVRRKRHNRLITLVLENPELTGIGIDESTACIFHPDSTVEVLGNNLAVFYDASKAKNITEDKNSNLAADNIKMSILKSGDTYNLKNREALIKK